ncbi:MAG: DUF192 domain-containing protein [Planctomycetes bacterium]|nr:DUF192 domain-containing protein [Planctomycetota bacterium]
MSEAMYRSSANGARWTRQNLILSWVALCALFAGAAAGCRREAPPIVRPNMRQLAIGPHKIWVEDATTDKQHQTGLMYRKSLEPDCGMLFTFPRPEMHSFYMKNCYMPIDLAYLEDDGTIIEIHQMKVEDDPVAGKNFVFAKYESSKPVRFALEMAGGWFAERGIGPGVRVEHIVPGK